MRNSTPLTPSTIAGPLEHAAALAGRAEAALLDVAVARYEADAEADRVAEGARAAQMERQAVLGSLVQTYLRVAAAAGLVDADRREALGRVRLRRDGYGGPWRLVRPGERGAFDDVLVREDGGVRRQGQNWRPPLSLLPLAGFFATLHGYVVAFYGGSGVWFEGGCAVTLVGCAMVGLNPGRWLTRRTLDPALEGALITTLTAGIESLLVGGANVRPNSGVSRATGSLVPSHGAPQDTPPRPTAPPPPSRRRQIRSV